MSTENLKMCPSFGYRVFAVVVRTRSYWIRVKPKSNMTDVLIIREYTETHTRKAMEEKCIVCQMRMSSRRGPT